MLYIGSMKGIAMWFLMFLSVTIWAEGTKELAPSSDITVNGRPTTDATALYINNQNYGSFAVFGNPNPSPRLHARVIDPTQECIYFGFSRGTYNNGYSYDRPEFRVYVKDPNGNVVFTSDIITDFDAPINNWQEGFNGPRQIVGADGYAAIEVPSSDLTSEGWVTEGDYYLEFEDVNDNLPYYIEFWDVTVADCSVTPAVAKTGRIWSEYWAFFSPPPRANDSNFDRPFNGSFFIAAPDPDDQGAAFIIKMDFENSGFRGAAFNVALNSFGATNTGSIEVNRRSIQEQNSIIGEYPVFLNDPVDLYRTASKGELELIGAEGCLPDNYCLRVRTTETGIVELLIDLFGNNDRFDPNSRDVLLTLEVDVNNVGQAICIPWDGIDGEGNPVEGEDFDLIRVVSSFRQGIYHFPIFDVEFISTGFTLESIRPTGDAPLLYYDDRNINFNSQTGSPKINLIGCTTPCHTWSGSVRETSYGNNNTINSWWFSQTLIDGKDIEIKFDKFTEIDRRICVDGQTMVGDSVITSAGEYRFAYSSVADCDSQVVLTVTEVEAVAVISADRNELNCYDPQLNLSAESSTPDNLSFAWMTTSDSSLNGSTQSMLLVNEPGTYTLEVREINLGCLSQASIEITENFTQPEILNAELPVINCYETPRPIGLDLLFDENTQLFNWSTGDGRIESDENSMRPFVSQPGRYIVDVQYIPSGCFIMDTFDVVQDTMTYIWITGNNQYLFDFCEQQPIPLRINSNAFDSIRWNPTEYLDCLDCLVPNYLTAEADTLLFTVTDTNGCQAQASVDIQLERDFKIYIPNAFSPNNDGINDGFGIFSSTCEVDIVEFLIFDRWGNKIFERRDFKSTDRSMHWDGIFKENLADATLFLYHVIVETYKGDRVPMQGEIHVVR